MDELRKDLEETAQRVAALMMRVVEIEASDHERDLRLRDLHDRIEEMRRETTHRDELYRDLRDQLDVIKRHLNEVIVRVRRIVR